MTKISEIKGIVLSSTEMKSIMAGRAGAGSSVCGNYICPDSTKSCSYGGNSDTNTPYACRCIVSQKTEDCSPGIFAIPMS